MIKKPLNTTKFIPLLILATVVILLFFINNTDPLEVSINRDDSFFWDFDIVDNQVQIQCFVTLINNTDTDKTVTITGHFPDDVENGLLKEADLTAVDENGETAKFVVSADSEQPFEVIFIGQCGGGNTKHDKNLPDIDITVIDSDESESN
ncbi:MAG: hypothetical protein A2Y17_10950 [Clostridiales bacterium GWF2_38_85]|nr:MAG: hypothetical protein A2Y17_10950 [Clostridiales bacterium GWF2_38_85]HBL84644.1 hypothetical protein [Clostridiales bacterium]